MYIDLAFSYFILNSTTFLYRLGFTYLRLKDNHMEILNREDEVERWASVRFLTMFHID